MLLLFRRSVIAHMLLFSVLLAAQSASRAKDSDPVKLGDGKGSFAYTDAVVNPGKPMTVWYFQPPDAIHARVLFVMHGTLRNGEEYRDQWVAIARKYGLLLIVPEFSSKDYPSARYNRGNIMDENDKVPQPEKAWTFPIIERLFDNVKERTGNASARYDMYGHSAGGQFVHRFVLLMPQARYRRAVAANAGYYTLPLLKNADPYPFSLEHTPITSEELAEVLQRDMVILLGENDTDPNDPDLYHSAEADRQGLYRLARGRNFDAVGMEEAGRLHVTLGWHLTTVPGVGHSNEHMAVAAAAALYDR